MTCTIAMMTIGRTPRPDIMPSIFEKLGGQVRMIECGALDAIADDQVAAMVPTNVDDALIASVGGGRQFIVSKAAIAGRLQIEINRLEPDVQAFAVLCTGVFHEFSSSRPIFQVGKLLAEATRGVNAPDRLGVLIPIAEQKEVNERVLGGPARRVVTGVASPYEGVEGVTVAARRLAAEGVGLIAMSCMGYTEAMRASVEEATSLPTISPGQVLADALNRGFINV